MWHARTEALRASGELAFVGIVQEQHPDRARLFAQWHGIEWPILWDPFNTLGDEVVPVYRLLDAEGRLRAINPDFEDVAALIEETGPVGLRNATDRPRQLLELDAEHAPAALRAVSELTFDRDERLAALRAAVDAAGATATDHFRLGVAHRMRFDSERSEPDDFALASAAWSRALELRPSQYIWRRRIQQFGPRLDKPYAFYDWVDEARAAITARGETPIELAIALTGSERNSRGEFTTASGEVEPDPDALIPLDPDHLFEVTGHAVFDTSKGRPAARLHLVARPSPANDGHWNNETLPARIWLDLDSLGEGWSLERRLIELPTPGDRATSEEARRADLELRAPDDFQGIATLRGYLITDACRGEAGVCFALRREFAIEFER